MERLIYLGVFLEVLAALLGTVSKQLIACTENGGWSASKGCLLGCGFFLSFVVGPVVDAMAYAFAPQTIVSPFASLDVLFNAISAPCTLGFQKEHFTGMHLVATLLVTGGAAASAFFGPAHSTVLTSELIEREFSQPRALMYFALEVFIVGAAILVVRREEGGRLQGIALGGVAGLLMGNAFLVKGFVSLLRTAIVTGIWDAFGGLLPYLLLVGALGGSALGAYFMQRGLRKFKGIYMVTILKGTSITCACLSGDIILNEMSRRSWQQWFAYWASIGVVLAGIVLINIVSKDVDLHDKSHEVLNGDEEHVQLYALSSQSA